jgi:LacI family transcriptional regulator
MTKKLEKPKTGGRITMHQIAQTAGVSLGTVSNVINGNSTVKEELRLRVLRATQSLGYMPNQLSRGLRLNKTSIIGMIIPDITNPFFPSVVRGVEDVAYQHSYRLILCNTDNDPQKEVTYLNDLRSFLPAGLLVIPAVDSMITWSAEGVPVVCIDRRPPDWDGDSVVVGNRQGSSDAANYLLRMGHRQIAVITGPLSLTNAKERLDGFEAALRKAKISLAPECVQEARFDLESGQKAAARLLRLLPRPTAIFATNDLMALGALSAVREAGLSCPQDVSIISFDGLDISQFSIPALTSVYQPGYQLGNTAARLLLERIAGSKKDPQRIVLPTQLRVKDSVINVKLMPQRVDSVS